MLNPQILIVVYKEKDELALNQLKKLINAKDDNAETDKDTERIPVKIVAWTEKTWLDNKKAGNTGNLDEKILFIGDIKGVDMLIPTLDLKYDQYGVFYGFSGKQAAITVDPIALLKKNYYDSFMEELKRACNAKTVNEKTLFSKDTKKHGALLMLSGLAGLATVYGDVKTIRTQQLLLAVSKLYKNDLDGFMRR